MRRLREIPHEREDDVRYAEAMTAYHAYVSHLMPRARAQFSRDSVGKTWDTTHWCYKHYFGQRSEGEDGCGGNVSTPWGDTTVGEDGASDEGMTRGDGGDRDGEPDDIKEAYKAMCLLVHPDVCHEGEQEATRVFQYVQGLREDRNLAALLRMKACIQGGFGMGEALSIVEGGEREKDLREIQLEVAYGWACGDATLRQMLIPVDEVNAKMEAEIERLREENEAVQREVRAMKALVGRAEEARGSD